MVMPKRIQRKRTRGWRKPKNTRHVGRGTIFGNPFKKSRYWVSPVSQFRMMMRGRWKDLRRLNISAVTMMLLQMHRKRILRRIEELRGQDISCWCREDDPDCHGDWYLDYFKRDKET